ncbi:MAG: TlyA family RNA methyltransferase [Alphaproteobacteria bacterium]|nr:TlyA family RNA methyltransferase [Alphaproteobacteria bacterium]
MRIDIALVNKGLFESRTRAVNAIKNGVVFYGEQKIIKPSFFVENPDLISVRGDVMPFVSRGGLKLAHALDVFNIDMFGRNMIDIGSSTGGFCDVALRAGVAHIVAVDTGSNQMHKSLRDNPKIDLHEQTDFRCIDDDLVKEVDIATIDISFISVTKIIDKLTTLPKIRDIVCLIKPQFECGPEISAYYRGVIRNSDVHKSVIKNVIDSFVEHGFVCVGLVVSPIKGGSGNIEYLAHFVRGKSKKMIDIETTVFNAFRG